MKILKTALIAISFVSILALLASPSLASAVNGAIFTTNSTCDGTNINIFSNKDSVYLNGGPTHSGSAGLTDGSYYVQVTEPNGTILGKSITAPIVVTGGDFASCYQLSSVVLSTSSAFTSYGYNTTSNPGGEYKVWVSLVPTFDNPSTKTDNFKVATGPTPPPVPPHATLDVIKFYDLNVNGVNDDNQLITGWKVRIQDGLDYIRYTPVSIVLDPDVYTVTEFTPVQTNWYHTTTNPVIVTLNDGDSKTVEFGNVCTGAGGGHTLGFWSNKNGQALTDASDLAALSAMNLRNANGANFDPTTNSVLRTWLLNASATNMSHMLSAQLAAMKLNVLNGFVSGAAMIYAPGATSANSLGFASVSSVMAEANTELGLHGLAVSGTAYRSYQETLKNALDKANNNQNFVQGTPCPFSF